MASSTLYNLTAESGVLAAMLRHPTAYRVINEVKLEANDFMGPEHKLIAKAIFMVVADGGDPDLTLVIEKLHINGKQDAVELVQDMMVAPVNVEQAKEYAQIVKNLSVNRLIGGFGADVISLAQSNRTDYRETLAELEQRFSRIISLVPEDARSPKPDSIIERLHESWDERSIDIGWSHTLQRITGGLRPNMYWVIGGFSSTGKSAVCVNMVLDVLQDPANHAMIVSAEMSQEQYMQRMLSIISGIPLYDIRDNVTVGIERNQKLLAAEKRMSEANLLVYDNLYSIDLIRSEARRVKAREGLDVLFVDFHQNVDGGSKDEISDARVVAIELQRLAKELQICVVDFSQLSNAMAQQDDTEKGLGSYYAFKGSGAIKDAADICIMLRRDRRGQSSALEMQVAKNRHGELAEFVVDFHLPTGKIYEPDWT